MGIREANALAQPPQIEFITFLKEEIFFRYGVTNPTEEEVKEGMKYKLNGDNEGFSTFLKKALDKRTRVDWSTGGHTYVSFSFLPHTSLPSSSSSSYLQIVLTTHPFIL